MKKSEVITGFKGYDKDLKCRGFQYEIGKKYETSAAIICESGFHFCKNPLDVLRYYNPAQSRFTEVHGSGKTAKHDDEDSKVACTHIEIGTEVHLKGIIDAGMTFVFSKIKWGKNDNPQTHGYYSAAQTHGDSSAAQTHGDSSAAQTHGDESVAVSTGYNGRAAGKIGNWLVLSEWTREMKIKAVKSVKVDGKKIKEDTFYTLKDGKFVEVK